LFNYRAKQADRCGHTISASAEPRLNNFKFSNLRPGKKKKKKRKKERKKERKKNIMMMMMMMIIIIIIII